MREARQELEDLQYQLETEQESLASLEAEQEELEEAWKTLETGSESRLEGLNADLQHLRSKKQAVESEISTLQQVIQFNEEMLEGASTDIANVLRADGGERAESVTAQLVSESEVVCWTCGSRVEQASIKETLKDLRSLLSKKHDDVRDLDAEINDIKERKESIESKQRRAEGLSQRRREVEEEIDRRSETLGSLREQVEEQTGKVEQLEAEAEAVEDESYTEILEATGRRTSLNLSWIDCERRLPISRTNWRLSKNK